MSTNRERFKVFLVTTYAELFQTPDYAMAAARHTPESLAEKMIAGLIDGTADKDGDGIKRACRALGLKHTYKTIREYLQG